MTIKAQLNSDESEKNTKIRFRSCVLTVFSVKSQPRFWNYFRAKTSKID